MKTVAWVLWMACVPAAVLAQADVPEEGAPPTALDPRVTFSQEAWRVKEAPFMAGLSLPPGFGVLVQAVDNQGEVVELETLQASVADEKLRADLGSKLRLGAVRWALVGLSVTGVVVPMVAAIPGALLGGALGGILLNNSRGTTTSDLPSRAAPLLLGLGAGAVLGLGTGAVLGLLVMVGVGQVVSLFLRPLDGGPITAAVQQHNRALATSLQLDVATLPAEYFPGVL